MIASAPSGLRTAWIVIESTQSSTSERSPLTMTIEVPGRAAGIVSARKRVSSKDRNGPRSATRGRSGRSAPTLAASDPNASGGMLAISAPNSARNLDS
jgi:hypothetical protein